MKNWSARVKRDYERTTRTWYHQPIFSQKTSVDDNFIVADIGTDDDIYRFLDYGTKIRYATMTDDFVPKTKSNSLSSGPGRGGLAFVNVAYPRPGIKARNFSKIIQKNRVPELREKLEKARDRATSRNAHRIR